MEILIYNTKVVMGKKYNYHLYDGCIYLTLQFLFGRI